MNLKFQHFPINLNSIIHCTKLVFANKSPIRIFHNYFLKNIEIGDKTIDLGCGYHSSYLNFLKKNNVKMFFADQEKVIKDNYYIVDLEKNIDLPDNSFDTVILFNVLEHIKNYNNLLSEINRILKKGGKLELFVPFMHRYHEDPKDIFRPTHFYLDKMLSEAGFETKTQLIGVGPFAVISEILSKYFKFRILKCFFLIIFLFLDRLLRFFSKDYNTYYNGIHCSCTKK